MAPFSYFHSVYMYRHKGPAVSVPKCNLPLFLGLGYLREYPSTSGVNPISSQLPF